MSAISIVMVYAFATFSGSDGDDRGLRREPRLAMLTGLKCSACHVNRMGGGARNDFGVVFAQTQLPARTEGYAFRPRNLNDWVSVGADVRVFGTAATSDAQPQTAVEMRNANVYVEARLIRQKLAIYIDETVGPGAAATRELFGLVEDLPLNGWAKFGKFIMPYGLRIVDDEEFTRSETGFNFRTPDQGVELGIEPGPLSVAVALTNGAGGGPESDDNKQVTGVASFVHRHFRLGASASHSEGSIATRDVVGGFGGFSVGPVAVLGEFDYILGANAQDQLVAFGEGNVLLTRGVNAKISYGFHDRNLDVNQDQRVRARFGLEVFPIPFLQASGYYTVLDDIPQALNQQDRVTLELHFYF